MNNIERNERIAMLFQKLDPINAELTRLQGQRLMRVFTVRRQKALLIQGDDILAETAALLDMPHTPIRPLLSRNAVLPGHPLIWVSLQWFTGLFNAWRLVEAVIDWRPWLIGLSLFGLVATTVWRVPPFRLALRGKYNDE